MKSDASLLLTVALTHLVVAVAGPRLLVYLIVTTIAAAAIILATTPLIDFLLLIIDAFFLPWWLVIFGMLYRIQRNTFDENNANLASEFGQIISISAVAILSTFSWHSVLVKALGTSYFSGEIAFVSTALGMLSGLLVSHGHPARSGEVFCLINVFSAAYGSYAGSFLSICAMNVSAGLIDRWNIRNEFFCTNFWVLFSILATGTVVYFICKLFQIRNQN
jgi:hypothetical protein